MAQQEPKSETCDSPAARLARDAMEAVAPGEAPARQADALAARLGVLRQTVWNWRSGRYKPSNALLVELAGLVGDTSRVVDVLAG